MLKKEDMKLESLLQRIDNMFAKSNVSFPELPAILIQCGVVSRGGMSAIKELQDAVSYMQSQGIPIDANEDGTPNMSIAFAWSVLCAWHKDYNTQNRVYTVLPTPAGPQILYGMGV